MTMPLSLFKCLLSNCWLTCRQQTLRIFRSDGLPNVLSACDNGPMALQQVTLSVPNPYSLQHSLTSLKSGRRDPTVRFEGGRVQCALLTPEGPVSVAAQVEADSLQVALNGEGSEWLEPRLPAMFGLRDDPSVFTPDGPVLSLVKRHPGHHLIRMPVLFHRLVQIVLHQLVTWEEAAGAWQVMVHRYGTAAPGDDGLLVGPTPETLRSLAYYDLVDCGVLPRQARLVLKLAAEHRRIERAWSLGDERLIQFLSRIPGIGAWTLQTLRGSCLGDADAVVTGDYGLPHTVCWFFRKQARGTDEEMLELLEPYRGHRYRVQQLLMQSGMKAPRRGPKMRVRTWR